MARFLSGRRYGQAIVYAITPDPPGQLILARAEGPEPDATAERLALCADACHGLTPHELEALAGGGLARVYREWREWRRTHGVQS